MCKQLECRYAVVSLGIMVYCAFYCKGSERAPNNCQIPYLFDEDDDIIIELTEEVQI